MTIILAWTLLSVAVGMFASIRRDRSGLGWFVLALIVSPLLAGIFVAILKERSEPAHQPSYASRFQRSSGRRNRPGLGKFGPILPTDISTLRPTGRSTKCQPGDFQNRSKKMKSEKAIAWLLSHRGKRITIQALAKMFDATDGHIRRSVAWVMATTGNIKRDETVVPYEYFAC
jgi:hypothetical protein